MTVTEAPAVGAEIPHSPTAPPTRDSWLDTGDHKRLGLLYLGLSLFLTAAGLLAAAGYVLPAVAGTVDVWTTGESRVASAAVTLVFVLGMAPAWIGLATYIVPLQIGATRLALPRLHAFGWWLHLGGTALTIVGYLVDRPAGGGLGSPFPVAAVSSEEANVGTQLWIAGLGVVAIATAVAAISLLTTIGTQRAQGMRVRDLAAFSFSVTMTSVTALLAAPVFLAGLLILAVDQRNGGPLFASVSEGGLEIWLKALWLFGRPDVYLLVAPAVGVFSEIVATAARRPLFPQPVGRLAIAGAGLGGLVAWMAQRGVADAAVLPTYNVPTAVVAAPFALAVLVWLGTIQQGKPRLSTGVPHAAAFAGVLGAGSLMPVIAGLVGVEGPEAVAFANGQITLVVLGAGLVGLIAATTYWSPKLTGRIVPAPVSAAALLATLGGITLAAGGQFLVAFGAGEAVGRISVAGFGLLALAIALLAGGVFGKGDMAPSDPYEGLTLEWLASSPPVRHNFDELPIVRSAQPLADARATDEEAG